MRRDFVIAVKAVIIKDNRLLLLRRSKKEIDSSSLTRMDAWDLPGGGVQFFETMEKALHREINEETSLSTQITSFIGAYDVIRPQLHIAIMTYLCVWKSGEVKLSDEHDKYIWIDFNDVETSDIPKWLKRYYNKAILEYKKIQS